MARTEPKQLLTRDIKQSGESGRRDLMIPPGKHVLAHTLVLFNTVASKQLITLSKRLEEGYTASPYSLGEQTEHQMIKLHDNTAESGRVSPLFHGIVFLAGFHLSADIPTAALQNALDTSAKPKL